MAEGMSWGLGVGGVVFRVRRAKGHTSSQRPHLGALLATLAFSRLPSTLLAGVGC